jgi:hypothetical protein
MDTKTKKTLEVLNLIDQASREYHTADKDDDDQTADSDDDQTDEDMQ